MPESTSPKVVTAALLVIGDEILSGRTKDKNIGYIADHLSAIGIQLKEVRIVPDETGKIVSSVNTLRAAFDYLLTTGGIGPTHDDITADAVAKAFGVPIGVDPRAVAVMKPYYDSRGLEFTAARQRMARIPEGADLVENPVSRAPGFQIGNVIVLAGVPNIMQAMLQSITPRLNVGDRMLSTTVTVHRPESEVAELFEATQSHFPDVAMGSYPFSEDGVYGAHLVLRSTSQARLNAAEAELKSRLSGHGLL
jgi:molybdenum cofactor synthesis domain-containing protein